MSANQLMTFNDSQEMIDLKTINIFCNSSSSLFLFHCWNHVILMTFRVIIAEILIIVIYRKFWLKRSENHQNDDNQLQFCWISCRIKFHVFYQFFLILFFFLSFPLISLLSLRFWKEAINTIVIFVKASRTWSEPLDCESVHLTWIFSFLGLSMIVRKIVDGSSIHLLTFLSL